MWTKKDCLEAAARGEGCLGKARDDEPVFIIVGDDASMAAVVRSWARRVLKMHKEAGNKIPDKISEALDFADEIDAWQSKNYATVKIPD